MTPERNRKTTEAIAEWLRSHDDVAVITHAHPDGDALGSSLALMHALKAMGKRAFVCNSDPTPDYLSMLPGHETVVPPDALPFAPQAVVAVDCADASMMGAAGKVMASASAKAVIDHHETNKTGIVPALVDSRASAAGELVYEVLLALNAGLTPEIALCLYVAISTDTGNFSFSNTTPEALIAVSECLKTGFDLAKTNERLFRIKTPERTKLLGRALNGAEYLEGGKIALLRLRRSDFAECGAQDADTIGIVNYGIDSEGAEAAILAVERGESTKFSLRARAPINAAQIAAEMGGGGHARAAGVTLALPFDEAVSQVLAAFRSAVQANSL